MSREQELIDICFSLVLTATMKPGGDITEENLKVFREGTNEDKAEWVAKQLRESGFDTFPCGASWGVLKEGP